MTGGFVVLLSATPVSVQVARRVASDALLALGRPELGDDVATVVSELVANAVIHARGPIEISVREDGAGVRVAVSDGSATRPHWRPVSDTATSGRGLLLVQRLSTRWGVEAQLDGKTVWALVERPTDVTDDMSAEDLLAQWADDASPASPAPPAIVDVVVTVDVAAMLDSRAHTDDLTRELQLIAMNEHSTRAEPSVLRLAGELAAATEAFHDARRQIHHQTLSAAQRGQTDVTLHLQLPQDSAAAARDWLAALDQADALTTQGALLLPPFPPALVAFRRAYIAAIISELQHP